jgi:hypothetical protein
MDGSKDSTLASYFLLEGRSASLGHAVASQLLDGILHFTLSFFYVGPAFTLPLFMAILTVPYGFSWTNLQGRTRFFVIALGTSLVGLIVGTYYFPHYTAPATCLILALILTSMQRLCAWHPRGRFAVLWVVLISIVMLVVNVAEPPPLLRWPWYDSRPGPGRTN